MVTEELRQTDSVCWYTKLIGNDETNKHFAGMNISTPQLQEVE